MTDAQTLRDLLGEWVTVRNPDLPITWYGRLVGLHDDPGLLLSIPGRGGTCLPQRFTVTAAAPPTHQPVPQEEARPFSELRDAGLLWLINRIAFHPRGLALALHFDDAGAAYGWSLMRNDEGEPWQFDVATDADGHARAETTITAALAGHPVPVDENQAAVGDVVHPDTNAQASTPPGVDEPDNVRRLDCPQRCQIPPGVTLTEVPTPRHAWSDVHRCPNDGCGRTFLARLTDPAAPA
ncbi:hypothetical protein ABZ379_48855 [Streptomyces canus]|uniref:hypothetical protein n=1 Tax=Streptomyces canus TaxID=58343 RepID=UPI0033E75430